MTIQNFYRTGPDGPWIPVQFGELIELDAARSYQAKVVQGETVIVTDPVAIAYEGSHGGNQTPSRSGYAGHSGRESSSASAKVSRVSGAEARGVA